MRAARTRPVLYFVRAHFQNVLHLFYTQRPGFTVFQAILQLRKSNN
jgi:hypothetical protein